MAYQGTEWHMEGTAFNGPLAMHPEIRRAPQSRVLMILSADPGVDVQEIFKGCNGYKRCWASIGPCPLIEFGNTLQSLSAMINSKKQRVKVAFAEKDLIKKIEVEWTALLESTMKNIINRHPQFSKYHECIPYLEKAIGKWYNREDVILRTLFEVHIHSIMKEETKRRWTHSRGQGQGLSISRDRWRTQTQSDSQRGTHSQGRSPSRETRKQESQYTSQV